MALLEMHRIFINSINSIRYDMLLLLISTIIRIETCFKIMASDTNNFRLWYIIFASIFLPEFFLQSGVLIFCLSFEGENSLSFFSWWSLLYVDP